LARNYAAEYERRNERAKELGFSSYTQGFNFRKLFAEEIELVRTDYRQLWDEAHPNADIEQEINPRLAAMFYEKVVAPYEDEDMSEGLKRHYAIDYFISDEGMSVDEAIAAMRMVYGES
jgi:hypothetical protein